MRFIKRLILFGILALLLIWGICILKCEIQTASHGKEFEDDYIQEDIVMPFDSIKILDYNDEYARVYYESKSECDLIDFRYSEGRWHKYRRVTVKEPGKRHANRVIWPYIWYYII